MNSEIIAFIARRHTFTLLELISSEYYTLRNVQMKNQKITVSKTKDIILDLIDCRGAYHIGDLIKYQSWPDIFYGIVKEIKRRPKYYKKIMEKRDIDIKEIYYELIDLFLNIKKFKVKRNDKDEL